jgi:hypothetical protein
MKTRDLSIKGRGLVQQTAAPDVKRFSGFPDPTAGLRGPLPHPARRADLRDDAAKSVAMPM